MNELLDGRKGKIRRSQPDSVAQVVKLKFSFGNYIPKSFIIPALVGHIILCDISGSVTDESSAKRHARVVFPLNISRSWRFKRYLREALFSASESCTHCHFFFFILLKCVNEIFHRHH